MTDIVNRLTRCIESGTADPELLPEALREITELRERRDKLEIILMMLVRTGWPWKEDGEPGEIMRNCKDGYSQAMLEARELLNLGFRSMINRTEPRT